MAIQRTRKISDLEKRLKVLNQQLYGKTDEKNTSSTKVSITPSGSHSFSLPTTSIAPTLARKVEDVTYLRGDLTKIAILATAAFTTQFVLYALIQNHLINLGFLNLHF